MMLQWVVSTVLLCPEGEIQAKEVEEPDKCLVVEANLEADIVIDLRIRIVVPTIVIKEQKISLHLTK